MNNYNEVSETIDKQTKVLVGILCKRIEVLEKHEVLSPKLYKDIVKETVYEWSRALKTILTVGKMVFKPARQK